MASTSQTRQFIRPQTAAAVMLLLAAGLLAGIGLAADLPDDWQLLLWLGWMLAGSLLLVHGGGRLFSPVLRFELTSLGRRKLSFVLRCALGTILLLALASFYAITTRDLADQQKRLSDWPPLPPSRNLSTAQVMRINEQFAFTVLGTEFLLVLLLTPALVAGGIAQEKEQRTLEFLLATDLDRREIILSKLLARLIAMGVIGLVGLPLLALMQVLGGVDFALVLAGFAVIGLTLVGLAGLSTLVSVQASRAPNALGYTYLIAAAYVGGGYAVHAWLGRDPDLPRFIDAMNAGNPAVLAANVLTAWERGQLPLVLPWLLLGYAAFHGMLALGCVAGAAARLHADRTEVLTKPRRVRRLAANADPLWWREVQVNSRLNLGLAGGLILALVVAASFLPFLWVNSGVRGLLADGGIRLADGSGLLHPWVSLTGTLVACLTFATVAARAAGGIAGERDRQTLDTLLTTPYRREAILFAKWFASIWSVRWAWLWLGSIWLVGVLTGALHVLALPLLAVAWAVFAALSATLGLWFSVHAASTLRATLATLVALALLWFGHWLIYGCFLPFLYYSDSLAQLPSWVMMFQKYGLTPPFTLQGLALGPEVLGVELRQGSQVADRGVARVGPALCGLALWAVLTMLLWYWTLARFRALAGEQSIEPLAYFASSTPVEEFLEFENARNGRDPSP